MQNFARFSFGSAAVLKADLIEVESCESGGGVEREPKEEPHDMSTDSIIIGLGVYAVRVGHGGPLLNNALSTKPVHFYRRGRISPGKRGPLHPRSTGPM